MSQILAVSEGAAIAMHTVVLLALHEDELLTTHFMSEELKVSENHCSKILQRLTREGLIEAVRGLKGGFRLAVDSRKLRLLDIYNAVEGKLCEKHCLFKVDKCPAEKCLFYELTSEINRMVRDFLENNTVYDAVHKGTFKITEKNREV